MWSPLRRSSEGRRGLTKTPNIRHQSPPRPRSPLSQPDPGDLEEWVGGHLERDFDFHLVRRSYYPVEGPGPWSVATLASVYLEKADSSSLPCQEQRANPLLSRKHSKWDYFIHSLSCINYSVYARHCVR